MEPDVATATDAAPRARPVPAHGAKALVTGEIEDVVDSTKLPLYALNGTL